MKHLISLLAFSFLIGCDGEKSNVAPSEGSEIQLHSEKDQVSNEVASLFEAYSTTEKSNTPSSKGSLEEVASKTKPPEAVFVNPNLEYEIKGNEVTITKCDQWTKGLLIIPETIEGHPVVSIGKRALSGCKLLTSITIPDSIKSIAIDAFDFCSDLATIEASGQNVNYTTLDGVLFNKEKTELIRCPAAKTGAHYTIPNSVNSIGDSALEGCENLKSITIPDSVTGIAINAFNFCSNLAAIEVNGQNMNYTAIDGVLLNKEKTELIEYPKAKKGTNYMVPDSVTSIGKSALAGCKNLTRITIPESVHSIGEGAFNFSGNLTSITLPEGLTTIPDIAFAFCSNLTSITIGNGVTSIGEQAFSACLSLKSITIPEGVTSIGEGAFINCNSLKSITIPDGVTSIEKETFLGCPDLKNITIPDSVTSVGEISFAHCTSLTNITIPKGVTNIEGLTFFGCNSLTALTFLGDAPEITNDAFEKSSPTIYRKADAKGWSDTLAGRPVKLITEKP